MTKRSDREGGIILMAALLLATATGCAAEATPSVAGDAASSDYLQARAAQWADFYGVTDPPAVDVVRYVDTFELDATLQECLTAAGYPTELNGGVNIPSGNEKAFAIAQYTCAVQYPVPEKYTVDWNDEQIAAQYRWTVEFVIPCLERQNHPVAPPPSESVFVDSWPTDPYFPFEQVTLSVSEENFNQAWAALEAACPQQIPGEVLWDGTPIDEWARTHGR